MTRDEALTLKPGDLVVHHKSEWGRVVRVSLDPLEVAVTPLLAARTSYVYTATALRFIRLPTPEDLLTMDAPT